ncbi:hypothetical protein FRB96_005684 [Tulasnella sp. 330]|nr:hypothetical protein FRB96_005684 [Tulasnella sp. 330]
MYFGLKGIKPLRWIGPIFLGCVTPHIPGFLFALFIPHLLMETIIFGLTLVATVRSLPKKTRSYTPMLLLLLRDGSIYFLIMFTVTAVNAFIWALAPPSLMKCAISPLIAISSVSGCRIILNLRSLHNSDDHAVHGKLNLSTFDLGDLELRTIVAPGPGSDLALLPSSSLNLVSHEPRSEWWQGDRSSERRFGDLDLEGGSPLGGSSNDVASKKVEPASSPGTTIDVVRSRHGGWVKFTGVSTEDVTLGDRGYSETLEPSNPNPNPSSQSAEKPRPVAHRRNPDHLTTLLTAHPRKYFGWKRSQDQTSLSSQRPAATPRHSVFSIVSSDGSEGDHEEQPLSPPVTHAQHPPPMILLRIGKIAPDAWKE